MNRNPLLSKVAVIGLLMLLLAVPLWMVRGLIEERSAHRAEAEMEVARAHAGQQVLVGPVLQVPYTESYTRTVFVNGDAMQTREEPMVAHRTKLYFPQQMDTRSQLGTETRWRGIFPVTVFNSRHDSTGHFAWMPPQPQEPGGRITLGEPRLLVGLSDLRGLLSPPQLTLGGVPLNVGPATNTDKLPARLPLAASFDAAVLQPGKRIAFSLGMEVAGTGQMGWVPLADANTVKLSSNWPHPSFDGDFLPRARTVTAQGFEASWSVPSLSTRAQQTFLQDVERSMALDILGVSLANPVDVYRLTERATKYATMFIVLTFAAFFVLEMVRRWCIHPMQYLMIGAALVLFFLMLLSFSEQIGFFPAYLLASAACIGLLTHYLAHVLAGWRPALCMSGLLVALYGVLYGILISEDNALMMGSLLLFGVLGAVMVATRRLDWYSVMGTPAMPARARSRNPADALINKA
ncbi:MAG: cell envelope integrity protein CreD [Hydrogenophaga sp.]